jgi:hypothetical protein
MAVSLNGDLVLEALENLLSNYPFQPVLWTLYAVNKRLAIYKPEMGKIIETRDYYRVTNPWLGGVTDSIRNIIAWDDTENGCPWYAYATIRNEDDMEMCIWTY